MEILLKSLAMRLFQLQPPCSPSSTGLLLRFAYQDYVGTADRARPFRRWPTVLHCHLRRIADLSLAPALTKGCVSNRTIPSVIPLCGQLQPSLATYALISNTIRFHGRLQGLEWAHPSQVRLETQAQGHHLPNLV